MKIKKVSIIKASIILSMVMVLGKLLSFFRDMLLAYNFGTSPSADAFLASNTLVMLFVTIIISPFAATFLPIATDYLYHKKSKLNVFFGTVYSSFLIIGIIAMILQSLFLDEIISFIFPGLEKETANLLYNIIIIQLPIIPITFLLAVNRGALLLINKFSFVEITTLFSSFLVILYFLITAGHSKVEMLSVILVIGSALAFLIQYLVIRKNGIKPKWNTKFNNPDFKLVFINMVPFILAAGSRQINDIVDKSIASLLPSGSISVLSYAQKISVTEIGLISASLSIVLFSQIAKFNSENDKKSIRENVIKGLNYINTLIIPLAILTIVLRYEIIGTLFGRGKFTSESVELTANTMMFYAIGMIGFGAQDILTRSLHATKHIKFPSYMSILLVLLNIILNLILYKSLGVYGIAIASSLAVLLIIVPLIIYFNIKVVPIIEKKLFFDTFKILLSSILTGAFAMVINWYLNVYINNNKILTLSIVMIISSIAYITISYICKNETVSLLVNTLKLKFIKKKGLYDK